MADSWADSCPSELLVLFKDVRKELRFESLALSRRHLGQFCRDLLEDLLALSYCVINVALGDSDFPLRHLLALAGGGITNSIFAGEFSGKR